MPKGEKEEVSETGNWNVAKAYSQTEIMGPLNNSTIYLDVATFGSSSLLAELDSYLDYVPIDVIKFKAFGWLLHELMKVIDNSLFAIKNKKDRKDLLDYYKRLEKIDSIKEGFGEERKNHVKKTTTFILKKELFKKALDDIKKIKRDMKIPINKNHLIFTDKEEFDPKAYKKSIMEYATTRG